MLEIEGPHCQQCSPELIIAESEGYVKREYRGEYRISVGGERNNLPGDSDIAKPAKNGISESCCHSGLINTTGPRGMPRSTFRKIAPHPRFLHGFEGVMAGRVSRAMAGRNNSRPRKREKRFFMLGGFIFGKSRENGRRDVGVRIPPPPLPALME